MSLRSRIGNWIAGNPQKQTTGRATSPALDFTGNLARYFGPGASNQPTHDVLLRECVGLADAATRAIANRISSLEPQVMVSRRVEAGTTEDEILDDHPLAELFAKPHPDISWRQLSRVTAQWIVTVGEAYWLKVGNGLGAVDELHWIPPSKMHPIVQNGVVQAYQVEEGDGSQRRIAKDTVIRFFFPDPENPWRSEGYFGPSAITADAHRFANEHLRYHYQHDATPRTVLEAQEGAVPFDPDSTERMRAEFEQLFHNRQGQSVGLPFVTPTHYKLVQLAMNSGADITPLLEYWRDDLLMAMGVPRSLLGQVVAGDRSSAETNLWSFDLHTVKPLASMIEDSLSRHLAPEFDESIFVRFKPFVSEDKEFELKREAQDLEHAIRTPNDVRIERGEDPQPWGEQPLISTKLKPYDPDERATEEPPAEEIEEDEAENEPPKLEAV